MAVSGWIFQNTMGYELKIAATFVLMAMCHTVSCIQAWLLVNFLKMFSNVRKY